MSSGLFPQVLQKQRNFAIGRNTKDAKIWPICKSWAVYEGKHWKSQRGVAAFRRLLALLTSLTRGLKPYHEMVRPPIQKITFQP